MRVFVFGENDDAAGVAVETMDDEDVAVSFAEDGFQRGLAAQAVGDAEEAGGFVEDDEEFVFKKNR